VFVIIGLSGSGKSTLVRCFNRLNKPTSGSIHYKDQAIEKLTQKELISYRRDNIAMVFQNFGLMSHRNVISNVEYGLEIKNVGKELRKQKAIGNDSNGWIVWSGKCSYQQFSGGMKQRVGLSESIGQ
jgi:glycine betaine/proline transport system ATP-binding protein